MEQNSFSDINARLSEISNDVAREDISLDDALELLEEAVSLGMRASNVIEETISEDERAQAQKLMDEMSKEASEESSVGAQSDDESGTHEDTSAR